MKTNQSFSILFWLYKSKAKNGKAPIYCRISINGERAEIASKRYVEPEKWISASGTVKGNSEEARTINLFLSLMKTDLMNKYNQLLIQGVPINPDKIKNEYLGISKPQKGILEVFRMHNAKMTDRVGVDIVKATLTKFETIYTKVQSFIRAKYHAKDIFLNDLNFEFIADFEHYLRVEKKLGNNTAMKYIQNFKKIIHIAVSNGWLDRNPFMNFKCTLKKVNREALTPHEVAKLEKKEFSISRLQEVKDVFLFCCYTGLSFIDVQNLTTNELTKGIDGNTWIYTFRQKTGTKSNIPLLPQALALVEKYKTHPYREVKTKIFPVKTNQKMNAYLKEVADLCGISKPLTMHIARHTFATTITLSNGVPIETVSLMLGHSRLATTQIYAKVLETKVSEDMNVLRQKLSKNGNKINQIDLKQSKKVVV